MAEPSVSTMINPNNSKKTTIGPNHHFLRTFRKSQNSDRIDNLLIPVPQNLKGSLKLLLVTFGIDSAIFPGFPVRIHCRLPPQIQKSFPK